MRLVVLLLVYCTLLHGTLNPQIRIPSFTDAQSTWYVFVFGCRLLIRSPALVFLPLLAAVGLSVLHVKPGARDFIGTRPLSRSFIYWGSYGMGMLLMVVIPIAGMIVGYAVLCTISYPSYGWVGEFGRLTLPAPTSAPELEQYRSAVDMLTRFSLLRLLFEQVVSCAMWFTAIFGTAQIAGWGVGMAVWLGLIVENMVRLGLN